MSLPSITGVAQVVAGSAGSIAGSWERTPSRSTMGPPRPSAKRARWFVVLDWTCVGGAWSVKTAMFTRFP